MTQKIKINKKNKSQELVLANTSSTWQMKVSVKDYLKKIMKDKATVSAFTRLAKK